MLHLELIIIGLIVWYKDDSLKIHTDCNFEHNLHPAVGLRLAGLLDYNFTDNLKSGE